MKGNEIVEKLGVTHQRVRQLLIKLHAQGRVAFGDPENPFWLVTRTSDKTPLLSYEEERVLSAIPRDYVQCTIQPDRQRTFSFGANDTTTCRIVI